MPHVSDRYRYAAATMTASPPLPIVLALHAMNVQTIRTLANDLTDATLGSVPFTGGNDARWVLGHLAITLDFAGSLLGVPATCPEAWGKMFGPGSPGHASSGPSKAELLKAIGDADAKLTAAYANASPDALGKPHGMDFLKNTPLVTVNDLIALLLTTHEAGHVAQLSACRRAQGFKPLF